MLLRVPRAKRFGMRKSMQVIKHLLFILTSYNIEKKPKILSSDFRNKIIWKAAVVRRSQSVGQCQVVMLLGEKVQQTKRAVGSRVRAPALIYERTLDRRDASQSVNDVRPTDELIGPNVRRL